MKRSLLLWLRNPLKSSLKYCCMIETSSCLPWKSSIIFGTLQQSSENDRKRFSGLQSTFGESSEIFGRSSGIFGKLSKKSPSVCLYNKQNNTRVLVDTQFVFSCLTQVEHSKRNSISTRTHVLSSTLLFCKCDTPITSRLYYYMKP